MLERRKTQPKRSKLLVFCLMNLYVQISRPLGVKPNHALSESGIKIQIPLGLYHTRSSCFAQPIKETSSKRCRIGGQTLKPGR